MKTETCVGKLGSNFLGMRNRKGNNNYGNESERDSQIVRKKTRWKWPGGSVEGNLIVSTLCLLIVVPAITATNLSQLMSSMNCTLDNPHGNVSLIKCFVSSGGNLTISQSFVSLMNEKLNYRHKQKPHKFAVDITCQNVSVPSRFNFTELEDYLPRLGSLSFTGCNFSRNGFNGTIPPNLTSLNLSHNHLEYLPEEMFYNTESHLHLSSIDLSSVLNLTGLPKSLLNLKTIETLRTSNNSFGCMWVAANFYPWFERNPDIIFDAKQLNCKTRAFPYTTLPIYGVLKAKYDEKTECQKVDKRCTCSIYTIQPTQQLQRENYPISFSKHGENMSVTLNVSCSGMNLTQLPRISPLTRHLNVSHNLITTLDELKNPEYSNLMTLVAEFNGIENIDVIEFTPFVKQFYVLGLRSNKIRHISARILEILLSSEVIGLGRISLEENYLECTCDTYYVKLLLAKHHNKIHDTKNIFCKNFNNVMVQELEYDKVCPSPAEDNLRWYIIITIEVCLIVLVLLKVWHDSRQYRQTGILPWCSAKMPRLPCDFMLEGIKERPNGH